MKKSFIGKLTMEITEFSFGDLWGLKKNQRKMLFPPKPHTLLVLSIVLIVLFCSSCGYHVDDDESLTTSLTLSVPYFSGDKDGALTDAVIKALALSGKFNYSNHESALTLEGKILQDTCENIGYQYDRNPISGTRKNRLIPNEGRRDIMVQITVIDNFSKKIICGPFNISAYSDYDFVDSDSLQDASFVDRKGMRDSALFFSLGQLDSMDGAMAASQAPLHRRLAIKIVEGLETHLTHP